MADYTDNVLLSAVKALEHAVLPAVDPGDPLATEQLRLSTGFLKFLRARIDLVYLRQVFERDHYLDLAEALRGDAQALSEEVSARLEGALARARRSSQTAVPLPASLRADAAELSACVSAVVRLSVACAPERQRRIEREVLQRSKRWVDMQRAWFLPQGFELRPAELPVLEHALTTRAGFSNLT